MNEEQSVLTDEVLCTMLAESTATIAKTNINTHAVAPRLQAFAELSAELPAIPEGPGLLYRDSTGAVRHCPIHEQLIIGRALTGDQHSAAVGLAVNDPEMSRVHCEISANGGLYSIRDRESTNGTFVYEMKLSSNQDVDLLAGAAIKAGKTIFVFTGR